MNLKLGHDGKRVPDSVFIEDNISVETIPASGREQNFGGRRRCRIYTQTGT